MSYTSKELQRLRVSEEVLAVRAWRRRLGIRQAGLAAMAGISEEHWQRVETGRLPYSGRTRVAVEALLARWRKVKPAQLRRKAVTA